MATAHIGIRPENITGSTNFKVRYRLMGDSVWTSYLIPVPPSSGTTATITDLLDNRIYDIQVQNINGADNALSLISQGIGFSDPNPTLSPTTDAVGYSFNNLSVDIDTYTIQLTTYADPGTIIASTTTAAGAYPGTITGTFSSLNPLTDYRLIITPVANQFSESFVYIFNTGTSSACADVNNLTASLTDITIDIAWDAPVPAPTCGYKAFYRRKADPTYTEYNTSGTTATVDITAPACYEGIVQSDCCGTDLSTGEPFGINAYVPLTFSVSVSGSTATATLSSDYGNPYEVLVDIEINYHVGSVYTTFTQSVHYAAGSTSASVNLVEPGIVVDSYTITAIGPVFDNGGQLQQLNLVTTPDYFTFYRSTNLSGTTWNGSPASLPSFTIDAFNVTEYATDGTTVLEGDLEISYIISELYDTEFTYVTIEVYDGATLLGSVNMNNSPFGARNGTISLVKGTNPLDNTTPFTMNVYWPDTTLIDSHTFYFP